MKRSLENTGNSEKSEQRPYYEIEVLTEREHIVKKLNGICNQLLKWGLSHNVADVRRARFMRAAIYATSIQLQALKDNLASGKDKHGLPQSELLVNKLDQRGEGNNKLNNPFLNLKFSADDQ